MNRIDGRRFAADGREMSGTTALSRWPRAAESVVDPATEIRWRVQGGADDFGRPLLEVAVRGEVDVICQRCLQPMRLPVGLAADGEPRETSILLASSERELAAWDEEVEDAEVVLANEPIDLDELLEDEFLLSLPFSPMCDDPACARRTGIEALEGETVTDGAATNGKANPFAVLRGKFGTTKD